MLEQRAAGVLLQVRAQPGARRSGIVGVHAGRLKVTVTAAPEKGKANAALIDTLAEQLQLRRSQVELVAGQTASDKTFFIVGIELAVLADRIAALCPKV